MHTHCVLLQLALLLTHTAAIPRETKQQQHTLAGTPKTAGVFAPTHGGTRVPIHGKAWPRMHTTLHTSHAPGL
jgi:hypothetical protein